jgi:hypothetical protein
MDVTCRAGAIGVSPSMVTVMIRPISERGPIKDQLAAIWY